MDIKISVDIESVVKLTAAVLRQLPYATNNAITRTAKEAVDAGRKDMQRELTIRKQFILNRIKILQYSKVGNLTAIIGVDTNVQGAPLLLGFLEEGGTKEPIAGEGIAIPLTGEAARPSFSQSVPTAFRYTNLNFIGNKGKKNTFIIPNVGVFQRIATGKTSSDTVEIYSFKASARLPIHTHLRDAMVAVIGQRFATIFTEEFSREILQKAGHLAG
jgi:hypothetical protein